MTDTPRTDARWPASFVENGYAANGDRFGWGELKLAVELCRELERENAALRKALETVANPNAIDASKSPLDPKVAMLALGWLTARPEFVAARAALEITKSPKEQ